MNVKIKVTDPKYFPTQATPNSSGYDLRAAIEDVVVLGCGERKLFPTGVFLEIGVGYEAQVRSRSGLALKDGIFVLNAPGTIDADYKGEIGVILFNVGYSKLFHPGDRIAQLVFAPVVFPCFEQVEGLSKTERGDGGFGSTGVS